eukprot:365338-Chlamydomonas_euryale.AAC.17
MGRWLDGTLYPIAEMCAVTGRGGQFTHVLKAARLTRVEHAARVPDESVFQQLLFAEGLVGLSGVVHRPRSIRGIGLWQLCVTNGIGTTRP